MDLKIDSKFALFSDGLCWSKKVPNILIALRTFISISIFFISIYFIFH